MKEKSIIFSSEMVRVILEGRKSQTRRVVKHKLWCLEFKRVENSTWTTISERF